MAVTLTNSGITYSDGTTQIKPAGLYLAAPAAPAAATSYTISNIPAHNKIIFNMVTTYSSGPQSPSITFNNTQGGACTIGFGTNYGFVMASGSSAVTTTASSRDTLSNIFGLTPYATFNNLYLQLTHIEDATTTRKYCYEFIAKPYGANSGNFIVGSGQLSCGTTKIGSMTLSTGSAYNFSSSLYSLLIE